MQRCDHCGSVLTRSEIAPGTCAGCLLATATGGDSSVEAGDSFGNYELICEIGEGGMGIVYLAEQIHPVRREVALKALKPGFDSAGILRRFETERQALALMEHPNIAVLLDAGTSSRGRPYYVMEFLDGLPITTACDRGACTIAQRLALFAEVCRAVEHAHRKGIVHRDLKPSNILITERDGCPTPKVIDFGIARAVGGHLTGHTMATAFGELLGTPEYMSPEQASLDGRAIGPTSDIYSLGVLLYELLAGVLPFDPGRLREVGIAEATRIIREEEAPSPAARLARSGIAATVAELRSTTPETLRRTLSRDLARVLNVCLQKEPAARYPSVAALADDIDRYVRHEPVIAQGPGPGYRMRKKLWRYRVPLGGAAIAVLASMSALWISRPPAHTQLNATPLTTYQGVEASPSFSPDGKDVAFAWNGEREDNWDIYRLHIGDTAPRRLTANAALEYGAAWSPDGKWIAFLQAVANRSANVMVMPSAGGTARMLTLAELNINPRKRWLSWSPNSQWLVLAHRNAGIRHQRVFAIPAAGGEQRQLTDLEDSQSDSDGQPALADNGRWLFFARDAATPGQIWRVPLTRDLHPAGAELRVAIPGFENKECATPIPVSSSAMLFTGPSAGGGALWLGSPSGGKAPYEFTELGRQVQTPDLSRDGRKLVFAREIFDTNIWRLDMDRPAGKEVRRERLVASTLRDQNAALSLDGAQLAFESNRGGAFEIWIASADGTNSRQITSFNGLNSSPQWSPDGRQIAFHRFMNGKPNIFTVSVTEGALRQLTFDSPENQQPVWSPDGKWIYYCSLRSGDREIWRIPARGGEATRVTRHGGFDLAFSPDGRWLYYSRLRAPSAPIWRMAVDGGDEKMLIESAIGGHVFATARRLYFARNLLDPHKCQIQVYDLGTGQTKTLATTDRTVRDRMAVSRDERSIYYTQVDQDGMDLMLVSNFR